MNDHATFFEARFFYERFHQVDTTAMNGSDIFLSYGIRYRIGVTPQPLKRIRLSVRSHFWQSPGPSVEQPKPTSERPEPNFKSPAVRVRRFADNRYGARTQP
jgi:hypothetical protein